MGLTPNGFAKMIWIKALRNFATSRKNGAKEELDLPCLPIAGRTVPSGKRS
jgi:hypothetical protein